MISDHHLDLVYLNNRHHDPGIGSFISVDPLVAKTGEPYIYGAANPITYSDPTGLETCGYRNDGDGNRTYMCWSEAENVPGVRAPGTQCGSVKCNIGSPEPAPPVPVVKGTVPLSLEWARCLTGANLNACGTPSLKTNGESGAYVRRYDESDLGSTMSATNQLLWCAVNWFSCRAGQRNSSAAEAQAELWNADDVFGDYSNAMLHTMWMALNAGDMPDSDARALGFAHERDWRDGYLDSARDLLNNEIGITIGNTYSAWPEVVAAVEQAALSGELWCVAGGGYPALARC